MVNRTTFEEVNDGDMLSEGYFNGIYDTVDETPKWVLLETLSPSGVSTVTSSALAAYDQYLLIFNNFISTSAAGDLILIRFNGDTGNNYTYQIANAAVQVAQTGILIFYAIDQNRVSGEIHITGVTGTQIDGKLGVRSMIASSGGAAFPFGGEWQGGNATQISTMTIYSSGSTNFSGAIKIYGRSF